MGWSPFRPTGLTHHRASGSEKGYTLFTPLQGNTSYLIDMAGRIVQRWRLEQFRLFYSRLLTNGNLLALGTDASLKQPEIPPGYIPPFEVNIRRLGGGATHLVEVDWDGNVVWQYENPAVHHDFVRLANGSTILPEWVELPAEIAKEVRGGYRDREKVPPLLSDDFIEIDAKGNEVSRIHLWQLLDPRRDPICPLDRRIEWTHTNSLDLTAGGDLVFSCRTNSRVGIIDRAGPKLVWKYGAPEVHHQHHASALANGNVQIFDNGMHRPANPRSAVVEVDPKDGKVVWQFIADPEQQFFSGHISGAERLPAGNVLVTEGTPGRLFEITSAGEVVWEFVSPFSNRSPVGMMIPWIFRAHRYAYDYAGLRDRELEPARFRELNRMYGLGD